MAAGISDHVWEIAELIHDHHEPLLGRVHTARTRVVDEAIPTTGFPRLDHDRLLPRDLQQEPLDENLLRLSLHEDRDLLHRSVWSVEESGRKEVEVVQPSKSELIDPRP